MQQTVGGEAEALNSLYLAVSQFGQSFDPNALSGGDAKKVLESASRTEAVLRVIKSLALVRIDETEAYRSSGHRSAADYGAAKTGSSRSDAQRAIKTAKKARRLPRTDEAMRNGDISAEQAEAIADAATVNPNAEDDLLRSAQTDDLGTLRKKAKQATFAADRDPDARMRRIHARRSLRHWTDDDGAFHAHLHTTPEAGARLLAALKPLQNAAFHQARKDGRREAPEAYAADALDNLARNAASPTAESPDSPAGHSAPPSDPSADANTPRHHHHAADTGEERDGSHSGTTEHSANSSRRNDPHGHTKHESPPDDPLATGPTGSPPGTSPTAPPGETPPAGASPAETAPAAAPRQTRSQPRATVHLNIDFAPLLRGQLQPGEICEIPGIGPVCLSTARALLGDATIELIIKNGADIASVVHYGRTVTTAQRHALETRDPVCIRPGCGRSHNLEIDHRQGWAITHTTSLDDLARLCPHDHDLKTHCEDQ